MLITKNWVTLRSSRCGVVTPRSGWVLSINTTFMCMEYYTPSALEPVTCAGQPGRLEQPSMSIQPCRLYSLTVPVARPSNLHYPLHNASGPVWSSRTQGPLRSVNWRPENDNGRCERETTPAYCPVFPAAPKTSADLL